MNRNIKYGFSGHLSPEFPSQIVIDVTEHCNLSCIHCPHDNFVRSNIFKGRNIDVSLHKKLIDEVAIDGKEHCKYLRYTAQGEPLLHPQIVEMITYATHHSKTAINLTTNGTLLKEKKILELLDAGVGVFDISIDAYYPATYSLIRKKGNLKLTNGNVHNLIKLIGQKGYQAKVVVSYVEQELNRDETSDFERYWKESGASFVVIRRLHSCAGAKEDVAKKLRKNEIERRPCLYPWERLVLSPTGQIGYCPADWNYKAKIAYLKDMTIKEIWQSDYMKELREAHLNGDYSNHQLCNQCPDWSEVRWPKEGRSYSDMMQELKS